MVLSAGPGTGIIGDYSVNIPRPREVADIRVNPIFRAIFETIWEHLRGEVMKAYARK
jgi:NitT/TauT family transport system ATP-binding protein